MAATAGPGGLALARLWTMTGTTRAAGVAASVGPVGTGVLGLGLGGGWGLGLGLGLGFHLHSLGLVARLVAELDEGHQHCQTQAPDQDVEDPRHIAQAEGLRRLVLQPAGREEQRVNTEATHHQQIYKQGLKKGQKCLHALKN